MTNTVLNISEKKSNRNWKMETAEHIAFDDTQNAAFVHL